MQQGYTKVLELPEYASVREQLNRLVGGAHSALMARMEHGDVEQWFEKEGTEFLRRLMQAHLDERAKAETQLDCVVGADGVVRNHVRQDSQRGLMTVFGEVQVRRLSYGQRGETSLCPLDAKLNLPPDKYSHGMRRRVGEEEAKNSFDSAVSTIERTTGGKVPKYQAEQLAAEISEGFEAFYAERSAKSPEATMDPLIMSMDGKGIVMLNDSLREATRQAAEREKHKLKTRLCRGEKRNRKRMATVATVYTTERNVGSAEAIMGLEERPGNPRARNKRVWASVEKEPEAVTEEMFQEALRRDPWRRRPWVVLVDGNEQQLKLIKDAAKRHRVNITLVLDFVHVLEYLWKAAYCFKEEGTEAAEAWVAERALKILKGKASDVAAGMRRSATLRKLSDTDRKPVDTCADYLLKYNPMLRYDQCLSEGFPIATGVIEGACRHLVKDRMDITGARWGIKSAEAVLKLRSLQSSGDFDDYWEFYKRQGVKQHRSRYATPDFARAA